MDIWLLDVETIDRSHCHCAEQPRVLLMAASIEVRPVAEECPLDVRARELAREEQLRNAFKLSDHSTHQSPTTEYDTHKIKMDICCYFAATTCARGLSPEETAESHGQWMAWFKRLTERGQSGRRQSARTRGQNRVGQGPRRLRWPVRRIQGSDRRLFLARCRRRWMKRLPSHRNVPACRMAFAWKSDPWHGECPIAADIRAEAQFAQV